MIAHGHGHHGKRAERLDPVRVEPGLLDGLAQGGRDRSVVGCLEPANRAITAYTVGGRLVWGFTALVLSRMFDELGWAEAWDHDRIVERDDVRR